MRRLAGLAVGAALALAAAGCGGGEAAAERLTKEEYIAAADAICAETDAAFDALGELTTLDELVSVLGEGSRLAREQVEKLRALSPPEADEATLEEAYGLLDQQIDLLEQMAEAARSGDQVALEELMAQGEPLNERADRIAADYGLRECGSD